LHGEDLRNLYFSPYIVPVAKSRRRRWLDPVGCLTKMRNAYSFIEKKLREETILEN
jgi:hypothetical protein